jgi:hypothetical protein
MGLNVFLAHVIALVLTVSLFYGAIVNKEVRADLGFVVSLIVGVLFAYWLIDTLFDYYIGLLGAI